MAQEIFAMIIFVCICSAMAGATLAALTLLRAADVVLRYFGHDTIGRFFENLDMGYRRRVRFETPEGVKIITVNPQ